MIIQLTKPFKRLTISLSWYLSLAKILNLIFHKEVIRAQSIKWKKQDYLKFIEWAESSIFPSLRDLNQRLSLESISSRKNFWLPLNQKWTSFFIMQLTSPMVLPRLTWIISKAWHPHHNKCKINPHLKQTSNKSHSITFLRSSLLGEATIMPW